MARVSFKALSLSSALNIDGAIIATKKSIDPSSSEEMSNVNSGIALSSIDLKKYLKVWCAKDQLSARKARYEGRGIGINIIADYFSIIYGKYVDHAALDDITGFFVFPHSFALIDNFIVS